MAKNKIIKNENKEVAPISLLLVKNSEGNVLGQYLNTDTLNFSITSLRKVDQYLEKIRKNRKKLSGEEIKKVILRCGTYLGEVIVKTYPKRFTWISYKTTSKVYEGEHFPLEQDITTCFVLYDRLNDKFWFPLGKVYKFIYYGRAENLWSFATICLDFKNKLNLRST